MTAPQFLPWLRRGLARGIGGTDDDPAASLPLRSTIKAIVDLEDSRGVTDSADVTLDLVGPADVVGLDAGQVVRRYPPDGALDVESNYFPAVELVVPDLPWLLTPAQATADRQRLRPWLVLVCVEEREGVEYDATAQPLGVLRLGGADAEVELPDLAESWAWAHVQSMVPKGQVAAEVGSASGGVIARLVCPRQLAAGRRYRAAVVPAFDVGRDAGLGRDVTQYTSAGPAWVRGAMPATVELPAYVTWTFTTSAGAGDFEELARRLEPDLDGGRMGYHGARVVDNGLLDPFSGSTHFEYEGTLVDPRSQAVVLSQEARAWLRQGMRTVLEAGAGRAVVAAKPADDYDPETDDPIVGPPMYGSWSVDQYTVPRDGWLNELNFEPRRRAAAGLGAQVVRAHQHDFLAAAWDQAGDVRALREELNRGRLAAEVGRSHARRFGALSDEALLQATGRLHVFVRSGLTTAAARLRTSAITPAGLTSPAFARQTRSGTVLARRAGAARFDQAVGVRATAQFVGASVVDADRTTVQQPLARFGSSSVGNRGITSTTSFRLVAVQSDLEGFTDVVVVDDPAPILSTGTDDVTGLAATVRSALDPMPSIVAGLARRLTGVDLDAGADLPTRVPVGPRFLDPLFPRLHAIGSELVLPGISEFGHNRVRLVEVNEAWIAAFLVGANHEWAREALWNEYPADLGATSFSHFWPRVPAAADLAADLHEWRPLTTSLADHVGGEGSSTVLLVRGDLIRRYPDTQFLLVTPGADGSLVVDGAIPTERTTWPAFAGQLDAETVFVGFDVDPQVVVDDGMYVGIEQPVTGPLFGLDSAADATPDDFGVRPSSWQNLSWSHVAASEAALAALSHVDVAAPTWLHTELDDMEWPRNSAHLAGITFQRPFRLLLPAAYLMPGAGR